MDEHWVAEKCDDAEATAAHSTVLQSLLSSVLGYAANFTVGDNSTGQPAKSTTGEHLGSGCTSPKVDLSAYKRGPACRLQHGGTDPSACALRSGSYENDELRKVRLLSPSSSAVQSICSGPLVLHANIDKALESASQRPCCRP